jgi:hypothetical protein
MSTRRAHDELKRLRDLALRDVMSASAEELLREDAEEGVDSKQAADELRQAMRVAAARILRAARPSMPAHPVAQAVSNRPPFDRLKAMVERVFVREPELKLAFRDGKRQSERDWTSLYDDLVEMGAIDPNAD